MRLPRFVFVILLFLITISDGLAYERSTHKEMSIFAVGLSEMSGDSDLYSELGLSADRKFEDIAGRLLEIKELVGDGARYEDGYDETGEVECQSKVFKHFYDPVHDRAMSVVGVTSLSEKTPDWALEEDEQFEEMKFSLRDARDFMTDALFFGEAGDQVLTPGEEKAKQDEAWGLMFQSLGHIIHLLQDMAQPQHVRNDVHLDTTGCSIFTQIASKGFEQPSVYEDYTRQQDDSLGSFLSGAPARFFDDPRDYWVTGDGRGISEYTNRNFLSIDTNFHYIDGNVLTDLEYDYPKPDGVGEITPISELLPEQERCVERWFGGDPICLEGDLSFYKTRVRDEYPNPATELTNERATTNSIFDSDLIGHNVLAVWIDSQSPDLLTREARSIFTLNRFNYDAMHKFLISKAVEYSTSFIDYFFRGRLTPESIIRTDQGVSLKVRNSVDAEKVPIWANEFLHDQGDLFVSYEYMLNGEVIVGSSQPVSLIESVSPGEVSSNFYDFTYSIPAGAANIKEILVFFGQLGNEEQSVAFGRLPATGGFVANPNYTPDDGLSGPRTIYPHKGGWVLSEEAGEVAGNIDWKGRYVNGRPTEVLTWMGPVSRYFDGEGDFTPNVFKDGELYAVAPEPVLGAAIQVGPQDLESIVVVAQEGYSDVVYVRPNEQNLSAALYDVLENPAGWREIGRFPRGADDWRVANSPWFFNGDGTEAQTMRRIEHPDNALDPNDPANEFRYLLRRLKLTISGDTATRNDLGNSDATGEKEGFFAVRECTSNVVDEDNSGSYTGTVTRTGIHSGEYVIAVDYLNNEEKFAKFIVAGSEHNETAVISIFPVTTYINSFENTYREILKYGDEELDVFRQNSNGGTEATSGGVSFSSFSKNSETDFTWLPDLGYLDVRHGIINYGYASYPNLTYEETLLDPGAPGTPSTSTVTVDGKAVVGMKLHLGLGGEPESLFSFEEPLGGSGTSVGSPVSGSVSPCSPDSDHTILTQGPRYSTNMNAEQAGFNNFSIGVDRLGHRFASHRYFEYSVGNILSLDGVNSLKPGPQYFNWLTNGNPRTVIPTGGEDAVYYPIGVR